MMVKLLPLQMLPLLTDRVGRALTVIVLMALLELGQPAVLVPLIL
jgi:hypothetical protein